MSEFAALWPSKSHLKPGFLLGSDRVS